MPENTVVFESNTLVVTDVTSRPRLTQDNWYTAFGAVVINTNKDLNWHGVWSDFVAALEQASRTYHRLSGNKLCVEVQWASPLALIR